MSRDAESIELVRRYYDALGEAEWEHLERNLRGRVSLEVHRRFLRRFVRRDGRVLEVGAARWSRFLEHEVAACAQPGALDGGTHILFAASRPG